MMVVAASTGHARCHHAQASKACEEECNKLEFQVVLIGSRSDLPGIDRGAGHLATSRNLVVYLERKGYISSDVGQHLRAAKGVTPFFGKFRLHVAI